MSSPQSKKSGAGDARVRSLLEKLKTYVTSRGEPGQHYVIPSLAAEHLGISTVETLGLLMLLEENGLLRHKYRIYCKDKDAVLLEVREQEDLPAQIDCKYCDRKHGESDLYIEVVFEIPAEQPVGL